jgi:hypothetical protein
MNKKINIIFCISAITAFSTVGGEKWWNPAWESRITFKLDCDKISSTRQIPFILKMSELELKRNVNPASFRVVDAAGNTVPYQFDDKNANGQLDDIDELSILLPVREKSANFAIYYSTSEKIKKENLANTFQWNGIEGVWNSLDNGLVRIQSFAKNAAKISISAKSADATWKKLAFLYYDSYKIDKKRGVLLTDYKVEQVGAGPVRSILRETWKAKTVGLGKHFLFVKEWSLFSQSCDVLLTYSIVNQGKYPIAWGYMCVGFYRVTPNGTLNRKNLRYAANPKGELIEGALGEMLFQSKLGRNPKYPWYDVFEAGDCKKSFGLGCVVVKPKPMALFLGLVGKTSKNLRMTESYRHRGSADTILPKKKVDCLKWYVIHKGKQKATSELSELLGGAHLTLLGQMDRH